MILGLREIQGMKNNLNDTKAEINELNQENAS